MLIWAFSLSLLAIFFFLSITIFIKTKRKLFGLYALYCIITFLYISSKLSSTPLDYVFGLEQFKNLNWLVQIYFYSVYYLFGLQFLAIKKNYPRFFSFVNRYVAVLLIVATGIELYEIISRQHILHLFYRYVFVPLHVLVAFSIIFFALKKRNKYTLYFVTGSVIYLVLAICALFGSNISFLRPFGIDSLVWFFLAVIIESSIFSYALGLMIWQVYKQQQRTSEELKNALAIIEQQIIDEKELRDKERILLQTQVEQEQLTSKVFFLQNKILLEQINAHFIFNVLNSIKVFVAEKQSEKAVIFLNKFARFIRSILDSSRTNLIPLSEEIKNMDTYLSIEKMRFEDKFQYRFDIAEDIDIQRVIVPTFLIQPFIENALWHGIMPAQRAGLLIVKLYSSNTATIIEIDDNGLGIQHTQQIKKNKFHKSVGINLVNEVVNSYNANQPNNITYTIQDKLNIDGSNGTKVTIKIVAA